MLGSSSACSLEVLLDQITLKYFFPSTPIHQSSQTVMIEGAAPPLLRLPLADLGVGGEVKRVDGEDEDVEEGKDDGDVEEDITKELMRYKN